jgi:hypothetical protein
MMVKQIVNPSNKRKSADVQILEAYNQATSSQDLVTLQPFKRQSTPRNVTSSALTKLLPLPVPSEGNQYNKIETVLLLYEYQMKAPNLVGTVVNQMLSQHLVGCTRSTLYPLLSEKKKGQPIINTPWSTAGRPRLLDDNGLAEIVDDLHKENGRSFGKADINKRIIEKKIKS